MQVWPHLRFCLLGTSPNPAELRDKLSQSSVVASQPLSGLPLISGPRNVEHICPNRGRGMILYTPPQNHALEPLHHNGSEHKKLTDAPLILSVQPNPPALANHGQGGGSEGYTLLWDNLSQTDQLQGKRKVPDSTARVKSDTLFDRSRLTDAISFSILGLLSYEHPAKPVGFYCRKRGSLSTP